MLGLCLLLVACADPKPDGPGTPAFSDTDTDTDTDTGCADPIAVWTDDDGDGFGVDGTRQVVCNAEPGTATTSGDCDDTDASVHRGARETCDGVDEDCDGLVDEDAIDPTEWHEDADEDGYGSMLTPSITACEGPEGWVADGTDCNDDWPHVNPSVPEMCNGWDDDCDHGIDDDAEDAEVWMVDADGDGFGDDATAVASCSPSESMVQVGGDCDDGDPWTWPGAPELCDGVQNDCTAAWVDDDGLVSWFTNDEDPLDLTASFAAGTPGAEFEFELIGNGGLLALCAGTWHATVVADGNDRLVVTGVGAAETVLVAESGPVVAGYNSPSLTVSDLTIRGGSEGIYGRQIPNFVVRDVVFEASQVGVSTWLVWGAQLEGVEVHGATAQGLLLDDTIATLDDVEVHGCQGSGVWVEGGGDVTLNGGLVSDNAGLDGAGVHVESSTVRLLGTTVSGNVASGTGGGLSALGSEIGIEGASFDTNSASEGGAMSLFGSDVVVVDTDFSSNRPDDTVDEAGAALWGLAASFSCDPTGCL